MHQGRVYTNCQQGNSYAIRSALPPLSPSPKSTGSLLHCQKAVFMLCTTPAAVSDTRQSMQLPKSGCHHSDLPNIATTNLHCVVCLLAAMEGAFCTARQFRSLLFPSLSSLSLASSFLQEGATDGQLTRSFPFPYTIFHRLSSFPLYLPELRCHCPYLHFVPAACFSACDGRRQQDKAGRKEGNSKRSRRARRRDVICTLTAERQGPCQIALNFNPHPTTSHLIVSLDYPRISASIHFSLFFVFSGCLFCWLQYQLSAMR